jgi:hypothetical protein
MTWRNGFLVDKGMHSVGVFGLMYVSYCSNIKAIFAGNKKCIASFCIRTLRKVVYAPGFRVQKKCRPSGTSARRLSSKELHREEYNRSDALSEHSIFYKLTSHWWVL